MSETAPETFDLDESPCSPDRTDSDRWIETTSTSSFG